VRTIISLFGATSIALLVLAGCQSVQPVVRQDSMIQTDSAGFSPRADRGYNTIEFGVSIGNKDLVSSWKIQIAAGIGPVKTWVGDSSSVPTSLMWDGLNDFGSHAAEGNYIAYLSVDYAGKLPAASASSASFVLDVTAPTADLSADPAAFAPASPGVAGPVTISVGAHSRLAQIQSWAVDVFGPDGRLFQSFSGLGAAGTINWDGKGLSGDWVQPAKSYAAFATIRDEFGLTGTTRLAIPVSALAAALPPAQKNVQPGVNTVQAYLPGFSPFSETGPRSIGLALTFGNPAAVRYWTLTVDQAGKGSKKTWTGYGNSLPSVVTWDGNTDAGDWAPDGTYTAVLSVDYGPSVDTVRVMSRTFVLDVTPPSGTIDLSTPLFSPLEASSTITLNVNATSPIARIDSWSMDIYDPGGNLFRRFSGIWPITQAVWDGKGFAGDMVLSAEDYPVTATVRDEYGNPGEITGSVPVDVLVEKTATGFRILSSRIFFKGYTADYTDVPADLAKQNLDRLDALAAKLKKFSDYKITIVGHAVSVYWDKPALGAVEQKEVLIPLSKLRAEAIKKALVARGIDAGRIATDGVGASDQLVPDSNLALRWQNRRASLLLEK
jgi:hypothetical protein